MYENRSMGILPMSSTGILPVAKTRDQHDLEGRATHRQDARATANAGFHTRSQASGLGDFLRQFFLLFLKSEVCSLKPQDHRAWLRMPRPTRRKKADRI